MSNSSAHDGPTRPGLPSRDELTTAVRRPVVALSFWTAVVLPFLYLPALFFGPDQPSVRQAVLVLMALHAVALFVGHRHSPA